jgi:hypothetical protein
LFTTADEQANLNCNRKPPSSKRRSRNACPPTWQRWRALKGFVPPGAMIAPGDAAEEQEHCRRRDQYLECVVGLVLLCQSNSILVVLLLVAVVVAAAAAAAVL